MELQDEIRISAPRDEVYEALNDPEVLRQSIPGCEELTKTSDDELEAKVLLKVGPVKARFAGTVRLDKSGAPENFSLSGEGSGGAAGFAKGGADVELEEDGDETILYNFATELLNTKQVSDPVFQAVKDKFGERGVVDLIGVMGYYQLVSMLLNVDRHPLPAGAKQELLPLK